MLARPSGSDPRQVRRAKAVPLDIDVKPLVSLLRLATKYNIRHVWKEIIPILRSFFPSTFEKWVEYAFERASDD